MRSIVRRHAGMCLTLPVLAAVVLAACTPRVEVAPPEKPITINLNIKLDADVRVRLEEAARQDIKSNPDIF